jgi:hypothetical protein
MLVHPGDFWAYFTVRPFPRGRACSPRPRRKVRLEFVSRICFRFYVKRQNWIRRSYPLQYLHKSIFQQHVKGGLNLTKLFWRHFPAPGSPLSAICIIFGRSHINIPKLNKHFLILIIIHAAPAPVWQTGEVELRIHHSSRLPARYD